MSFYRVLTVDSSSFSRYFGRSSLSSAPEFGRKLLNFNKYSKKTSTMEDIVAKNEQSNELLTSMKMELHAMQQHIIAQKKQELRQQNEVLRLQVERTRLQLVELMKSNGKPQITVPGMRTLCTDATNVQAVITAETPKKPKAAEKENQENKPKKEKSATTVPELPVDVGRLDLRIGKILEVTRHPDADSLYVEKIDCGDAQPRTIVSGLVKHVPIEQMQNRFVVVLCNLKPAKMRGVTSEGMVMCASTTEKVELLSPPTGAVAGDLVACEGYERQPDVQLNPKKKIFESVSPDLKTSADLLATYKGAPLFVMGKGRITAPSLSGASVK